MIYQAIVMAWIFLCFSRLANSMTETKEPSDIISSLVVAAAAISPLLISLIMGGFFK